MARTMDRRSFLRLGAAAGGCTVACGSGSEDVPPVAAEPGPMRYRPLGATGIEVSEIAFGAHGVDNAPLMAAAVEVGINTFCTSGSYLDGREEEALGAAIARTGVARDRVVILTGNMLSPTDTVGSILKAVDNSLRRLRTDHIDVYYNAQVNQPAQVRSEALLEAFDRARDAGKIRCLGLSGHGGGMQICLQAGIAEERYTVFFIKYDFVSYPDLDEILERAARRGVGTIVFKTTAGNRQRQIEGLERGGLSFPQATWKWALSNADVASVAVTITSFDQLREAAAAAGVPLVQAEADMLRRYADVMGDRICRFCATCEAGCPHGVAVADVMRYEMYFSGYGREKEAMSRYGDLPGPRRATACAGCAGPCDRACSFGREVRAGLVDAHRRLSFVEA